MTDAIGKGPLNSPSPRRPRARVLKCLTVEDLAETSRSGRLEPAPVASSGLRSKNPKRANLRQQMLLVSRKSLVERWWRKDDQDRREILLSASASGKFILGRGR